MKISTKFRYGLRAMIELAIHEHDTPLIIQKISEEQNISKKYLELLLIDLKKAGLVRSIRGSKGGYILSKNPDKITAYDIICAVEGPVYFTDCAEKPEVCPKSSSCAAYELYLSLSEKVNKELKKTTLNYLVSAQKEKQNNAIMYYI